MLFHLANLPYWLFLGAGLVCFGLIILSGDGDDDLELGLDPSVDLKAEADSLPNSTFEEGIPWQVLGWFGLGKAPLMLLLAMDFSLWGVGGWILNVAIASLTGTIPYRFWGLGGLVLFLSLGWSLWLGRLLSRPIAGLFVSFSQDSSQERIIGCVGTVTSKKIPYLMDGKIGQARVYDAAGNLLTISVSLPAWATVIPHHNQEILIIDQSPQGHGYLAIAKDSSDEDKWINSPGTAQTDLPSPPLEDSL